MNKFFFLLILGVTFFSSCSDDDDGAIATYNGDKLELSVSGVVLSGKEVVLDGMSLTLKNVIPGEGTTLFLLTTRGEEIQGTNKNTDRELTLTGSEAGGKLVLKVGMKVLSPLVGKWNVKGQTTALLFNLQTDKKEVYVGTGKPTTPDKFVMQMKHILVGPIVTNALEYIILEEDGNITAFYADDLMASKPNYIQSPKGMALYNVIGNKIYVGFDLMGVIADVQGRSDVNSLTQAMEILNEGLPLEYKVEGKILSVWMTRDTMLPFLGLVPMIVKSLPEEQKPYGALLEQIATIIKESNSCELGLTMVQASE